MNIGIPRESRAGETRVAATPETVKKLAASGKHSIVVEAGAGVHSSIPDAEFHAAGARIGIAASNYGRFMPMLMTAAGTVKAARVLILGVGVAGLQAIATAKRLGAVIEASDVRPSVKDQVESLGAKWVDVPYANDEERKIAEGVGGYARPMPPEWMARQADIIHERCKNVDILITTALIPGRPAPKLLNAATVATMKTGAVIVDR